MKKLELDKIICHDVTKPFPLPDDCIDCVITSPPYWNLRDYGKDVRSIFGGDPNCKHEWGDSFWNDSYCLLTTGQVTLDQLKNYVENQGK